MARIDDKRLTERGDGLIRLSLFAQQVADVVPGAGIPRRDVHGAAKHHMRAIKIALHRQDDAEVVQGVAITWRERENPFVETFRPRKILRAMRVDGLGKQLRHRRIARRLDRDPEGPGPIPSWLGATASFDHGLGIVTRHCAFDEVRGLGIRCGRRRWTLGELGLTRARRRRYRLAHRIDKGRLRPCARRGTLKAHAVRRDGLREDGAGNRRNAGKRSFPGAVHPQCRGDHGDDRAGGEEQMVAVDALSRLRAKLDEHRRQGATALRIEARLLALCRLQRLIDETHGVDSLPTGGSCARGIAAPAGWTTPVSIATGLVAASESDCAARRCRSPNAWQLELMAVKSGPKSRAAVADTWPDTTHARVVSPLARRARAVQNCRSVSRALSG